MKHIEFKSGFVLDGTELNDIQSFLGEGIRNILTDLTHPGVLDKISSEKIIYTGSTDTLGIYYFTAYDKYGNRIVIPHAITANQPSITGLRPDFTKNALLTDLSTTNFRRNRVYYVVVRYKESPDTSIPIVNVITKERGYPYMTPGYEFYLRLTETQINDDREDADDVDVLPVIDGDIILAKITIDRWGNITPDESVRERAYVAAESVAGVVTNITASNYGETQSFEDHINAIGSGTVTSTNIHGLSAEDLGIDIGATGNHQKLLHVNGIRTDSLNSTKSAFYPYYLDESATDRATVYIAPLSLKYNECCVIGGTSFFPASFSNEYTYSFEGRNSDSYAGYYLYYVDANAISIQVLGPVSSEKDSNFTAIMKDPSKLPICSLKWGVVTYSTEAGQLSNWGIIPGTFKDQRRFFNMSTKIIRPDEIFSITQFAPLVNDNCYLHNARIVGTHNYGSFNVSGKRLTMVIDGDMTAPVTVTFTTNDPNQIVEEIIAAATVQDDVTGQYYIKAYPYLTPDGYLAISAATSICLMSPDAQDTTANSAADELGFVDQLNIVYAYPNIQIMIYTGDRNGYIDFTYEKPLNMFDQGNLTRIDYYLGGGVHRYNTFTYDPETNLVTRVEEAYE